jgi:hypothetical protein
MPIRERQARWAVAGYRLLLLAFPRAFRREFGKAMTEDFRSLCSESMSGVLGDLRTLSRESIDLVSAGLRQRRVARLKRHVSFRSDFILDSRATIGGHMSTLWTDVRYGVRMILKSPAFSAIAIIVLGVGIGANTAIFSVVDGVLLRPLEYPEADELVTLRTHFMSEEVFGLSELQLLLFENQSKELEEVGGIFTSTVTLGGSDRPERVSVTWVTSDLLRALGVAPLIGRPFRPEDEVVDAEAVAILSHGMWSQRFGADPDIIGQQIWISDQPVTIVGVMPAGFHHPIDNFGT